jgi:coproporphyrinogen III oxidase
LDDADRQILVDLIVVATDAALWLKHHDEKRVVGRFLFDVLARAHLGRIVALQRIADEINDEL